MSVYRDQPLTSAPDVLILSGLDPSGGAGFLADARVVHMLGGRPVGAITAMTVQDTRGVSSVHEVDLDVLSAQLGALLSDVEIKGVKIGMLYGRDVVEVIDEALAQTSAPVVWDPIAAPSRGAALGREALDEGLRRLGPHLTLITPNSHELALLAGAEVSSVDDAIEAARSIARIAQVAVLAKGGHLASEEAIDALCFPSGEVEHLRGPRIASADVHGTGCALSSAIATYLARGQSLSSACLAAKQFVAERIAHPARPGQGAPSVV